MRIIFHKYLIHICKNTIIHKKINLNKHIVKKTFIKRETYTVEENGTAT